MLCHQFKVSSKSHFEADDNKDSWFPVHNTRLRILKLNYDNLNENQLIGTRPEGAVKPLICL